MKNIDKYYYRYRVISLIDRGFCSVPEAAWELELSTRHVKRLLSRYRRNQKKFSAILPVSRPPAWNGKAQDVIKEIIHLKKENPRRSNQHIAEMVEEKFGEKISRDTVRLILIRNDCYEKTERERRVFQKLEEKITHSGQMVQFDACEGAWLKGYRRVYLVAFMDAYSRYILNWKWVDSDSAWNSILILRSLVLKYGVPDMFYTDNASFYKVIRHNRSFYQEHKPDDEYETTIQRIILNLGSILVNHQPYEPQGKGRLERFFWFMQDRFIKEHTATNLQELNKQFRAWVKWYNTKHIIRTIGCRPKDRFDPRGFKQVLEDLNIERVFSYQYSRKVDKYNSFQFDGKSYTIDSKNCKHFYGSLAACRVQLYVTPKTMVVYHGDIRIQKFKGSFSATKKQKGF